MATVKKQTPKMMAGEMTGKMYKKSAIDKIGDKQAKELDKVSMFGKGKMVPTKAKMAMGGKADKAKGFPDLNKDGKITKADILVGRGAIKAKKGTKVKPCMSCGGKMAKGGKISKKK